MLATLSPGSTVVGTLAPGGADYYQITSATDARLSATASTTGSTFRLVLLDAGKAPIVESDGGPFAAPARIDEHVPAGQNLLEVQSLGGGGAYTLSADPTATAPPFQSLPTPGGGSAIAVGDFLGAGGVDLLAADGVHPGAGDGSFGPPIPGSAIPGLGSGTLSAVVAAKFTGSGRLDAAVTVTAPDASSVVLVLRNTGGGVFQIDQTLPIDASFSPGPLVAGDFVDGRNDLAVGVGGPTPAVVVFGNDGAGGFTLSSVIPVDSTPIALVAGDFEGDGRDDLAVTVSADSATGQAPASR